MLRIVVDTNVFVSSFIQKSYPFLLSIVLTENKIQLCISEVVLKEYFDVLHRDKFSKYPDFILRAEIALTEIESKAKIFLPKRKLKIIRDLSDNKFLELAAESKAAFLITGNTNDFKMKSFRKTKIVSPKDFWEQFSK